MKGCGVLYEGIHNEIIAAPVFSLFVLVFIYCVDHCDGHSHERVVPMDEFYIGSYFIGFIIK